MALFLGLLLFAFILTAVLSVPYINLLYHFHLIHHVSTSGLVTSPVQESNQIHQLHNWKEGTPVGGGVLIIVCVVLLYFLLYPISSRFGVYVTTGFPLKEELNVIFFTFIAFGLVGLYDDLVKIFSLHTRGLPFLPAKPKKISKLVISFISALLLYQNLKIDFLKLPYFGVVHLGLGYVLFAALVIWYFASAVDFTDGLDGLAGGLLLICLFAFWAISVSILDTPITVFIALWSGSLLAFLYFNIFPARIWLGNAGSLSFGATLAVVALLLGKPLILLVIGGIFVLDFASAVFQTISLRIFGRKLFPIAPAHHWLQLAGWPEPKIVLRLWILGLLLAVFGLWLVGS